MTDFYFPATIDEIEFALGQLPNEHTVAITHVWLKKIKKGDYEAGDSPQGSLISGSKVVLVVLYPFPVDLKMRFGMKKPLKQALRFYEGYCCDLRQDETGWFLMWTEEEVKRYFLERLLLREIGHSVDDYYNGVGRLSRKKGEEFADQYAYYWGDSIRGRMEI